MASLGELFIQLAFEGDTKGAQEFQKKVNEVCETLQKNAKEALENNEAVEELSEALTDNTDTVKENSETLQENTQATEENTQVSEENARAKQENSNVEQQNTNNIQENTQAKNENIKAIKKGMKVLAGYATAISGAIYAVHRLTDSLIKENLQWLNLTRTSDVALSTFQKWDSVGKTYGINNAAEQIKNLNDRLFELKLTGQGARGFMLAGINPTNVEDVMNQLRNRVSGLNDTSASYLLKQIGLDPSMLHILRMSREEFEGINAELSKYRLTDRQRKDLQTFNVQIQIAAQKLQYLKQQAIIAIMPAFIKFIKSLARVTEGVSVFVRNLSRAISMCTPLEKGLLAVAAAIGVIRLAVLALTAHPIIAAITAIIGVLYLLIDDIVGYFQGKKSFLGGVLYTLNEIKDKMNFQTPEWIKNLLYIIQHSEGITGILSTVKDIKNGNFEVKTQDMLKMFGEGMLMTMPATAIPFNLTRNLMNNINNNNATNNYHISMYNNINTSETSKEIMNGLYYEQNAFAV